MLVGSILLAEDNKFNRLRLSQQLEKQGHRVEQVENGQQAMDLIRKKSFDLLLLDIIMPVMDGYQVLEQLNADVNLRNLPVIVISGVDEMESIIRCVQMGADDYLPKPVDEILLRARIGAILEKKRLRDQELSYVVQIRSEKKRADDLLVELNKQNAHLWELVQEQVAEISNSQLATIVALAKLAESRDDTTGKHIERTQTYCKILASRMKLDAYFAPQISDNFIESIYNAAPLHDIGKVGIPDHILLKPAKLTIEEFEIMKNHALIGANTLLVAHNLYPNNVLINMGIDVARSHHEKWDGSGYPYGLTGENIPLSARIMAIADVYDALCSQRPYKTGLSHVETVGMILEGSGRQFDPAIIAVFKEVEVEFNQTRSLMAG
ncbi:MAG: HD domain-containing phosphohydrolase [Chloroflexota bacterium]